LLRKIDEYGTPLTRFALQLMALTFVRASELIGARWNEIDTNTKQWRIPAERMKMKSLHIVPLSEQAHSPIGRNQKAGSRRHLAVPE